MVKRENKTLPIARARSVTEKKIRALKSTTTSSRKVKLSGFPSSSSQNFAKLVSSRYHFFFSSESRTLDAIAGGQPLLEGQRELIGEPLPGLVAHLVLESVEDLVEHLFELRMWALPGSDGVAEKDEVVDDAAGIDADHLAHAAEGRILLVVVPDVSKASAPWTNELRQGWRHVVRADEAHAADGDGCVLQQGLGRMILAYEVPAPFFDLTAELQTAAVNNTKVTQCH